MKVASNRISDIYTYYLNLLQEKFSYGEAQLLLKRALAFYLDMPIYKIPQLIEDERVGEAMMLKIHFAVKDLLSNKPLEYIISQADFYEMKLEVSEDVLIPRPETEELVDLIWKASAGLKKSSQIIDIGTGSGCIAISLNKLLGAEVVGIDVSKKALAIAQRNSERNNAEVEFLQMNFLDESLWVSLETDFDLIVSNPPYVRESEKSMMKENVLNYEPDLALFVDDKDPLIFYRKIASFGQRYLKPQGRIFLEINEFLGDESAFVFKKDYKNVHLINDLNGKNRFLLVEK